MTSLFIDDLRNVPSDSHEDFLTVRTSAQAIAALKNQASTGFSYVCFDHDLGENDDIWPVIRWLEKYENENGQHYPIRVCSVHSANPVGAARVKTALSGMGYLVVGPLNFGV